MKRYWALVVVVLLAVFAFCFVIVSVPTQSNRVVSFGELSGYRVTDNGASPFAGDAIFEKTGGAACVYVERPLQIRCSAACVIGALDPSAVYYQWPPRCDYSLPPYEPCVAPTRLEVIEKAAFLFKIQEGALPSNYLLYKREIDGGTVHDEGAPGHVLCVYSPS